MKEITLFHLENCPYCKRARAYLDELKEENPQYAQIPLRMVEERQEKNIADQYDYYYVPCFYIGEEKVAEGAIEKEGVQAVLDKAL